MMTTIFLHDNKPPVLMMIPETAGSKLFKACD